MSDVPAGRVEIGCHLPVYGEAATREAVLGFARRVEALGFESLWVSDHVVLPWAIASRYPYSASGDFPLEPTTSFLEPLTTLSLVAGATERIRLGTSVLVLPHRHPVLLAKMLATLDHLSAGRVILGVGVGWMREEIELLGAPFEARGAWSDEALAIMRACWTGERVAHRGRFFRFDDLGFAPKPARGTIPVWIGGHSAGALRRVARLGDGWHAAFPTADALERGLGALRAACAQERRDPATLALSCRVGLPSRRPAAKTVDELRALVALGVRHIVLESATRSLAEMLDVYERFARDVRPRL